MQLIQLEAIPNQSFSCTLDGERYDITVKETAGVMSMSIARNNEQILSNSRILAGEPIIQYRYKESGNFIMTGMDGDLIYYTHFGVTQNLIYASQSELDTIREIV